MSQRRGTLLTDAETLNYFHEDFLNTQKKFEEREIQKNEEWTVKKALRKILLF